MKGKGKELCIRFPTWSLIHPMFLDPKFILQLMQRGCCSSAIVMIAMREREREREKRKKRDESSNSAYTIIFLIELISKSF